MSEKTETVNQLVTFKRDKETKNTFRFTAAIGESPITGSIYVPKELVSPDQQSLEVSFELTNAPVLATA